jgi:hypothetical protein
LVPIKNTDEERGEDEDVLRDDEIQIRSNDYIIDYKIDFFAPDTYQLNLDPDYFHSFDDIVNKRLLCGSIVGCSLSGFFPSNLG